MPRLLDLFAGRLGWSKTFLAAGWEVVAIDLVAPPEVPEGCIFIKADILDLGYHEYMQQWWIQSHEILWLGTFDFICASSPCEQFSVHGMKHFHPNPKYPKMGIRLFEHTRAECERSELPYVMENVRSAQKFVGKAAGHAGSFYLWGNAVPAKLPKGLSKGFGDMSTEHYHRNLDTISPHIRASTVAEIPAVLAQAVLRAAEDPSRRRRDAIQETLFT